METAILVAIVSALGFVVGALFTYFGTRTTSKNNRNTVLDLEKSKLTNEKKRDIYTLKAQLIDKEIISIEKFDTSLQHIKDIIFDLLNFPQDILVPAVYLNKIYDSRTTFFNLYSELSTNLEDNIRKQLRDSKSIIYKLESLIHDHHQEAFINLNNGSKFHIEIIRDHLRECQDLLNVRKADLISKRFHEEI